MRTRLVTALLILAGWLIPVLSVNLRTQAVGVALPYSMEVSPRIGTAPVVMTVRVRIDRDRLTRGAMCVIVGGAEDHNSCWLVEELDSPLVVRRFPLKYSGEYEVVVNGPAGLTTSVPVILN